MERLVYPHKPISSIKALSGLLQIPENDLIEVANKSETFYYQNAPKIKKNGGVRITYTVGKRLKYIQSQINDKILTQVKYPRYLQGSIKDKKNPRSYDRNAEIHINGRLVISEDAYKFFDSISDKQIFSVWKNFFKFTPEVSELLTKLTTYRGRLAQGSPTSSYLANIVMRDIEPIVVEQLKTIGFTYSRYVDDINLSTKKAWIPEKDITRSILLIYGMLRKVGVRPNRKKHQQMDKSATMIIHNLVLNSGKLTINKKLRESIELEVYNLKKFSYTCSRKEDEYKTRHNSLVGQVRRISRFHPSQGKKLMRDLSDISPL